MSDEEGVTIISDGASWENNASIARMTPANIWMSTHGLRFIVRDGEKILQQAYQNMAGFVDWRDVPTEVETEKDDNSYKKYARGQASDLIDASTFGDAGGEK